MVEVELPPLAFESDEHADHGLSDIKLIFVCRYDNHFFIFVQFARLVLLQRLQRLLSHFAFSFDLFLKLFHLVLELVELLVNHTVF